MFGLTYLKPTLKITATTVSCPVAGCKNTVHRQRKKFRRDDLFFCHDHEIYISPSTFAYADESQNLLWMTLTISLC